MKVIDKKILEKLIEKPRAFRNSLLSEKMPVRKTMILLGADTPTNYEMPRNHEVKNFLIKTMLRQNRKYRNNEPIF